MSSTDPRHELNCSFCKGINTDPATLPCGHNFCQSCIGNVLGAQEGSGGSTCPECRAKIVDCPGMMENGFPEKDRTGISCTYCIYSPAPAAKTCLHCEASLCEDHLKVHSKSGKHILTEPTNFLGNRKCSVHNELLHFYCQQDRSCICASCSTIGEHKGHKLDLLNEASEKKKVKLRNLLQKVNNNKEEIRKRTHSLEEDRKRIQGKAEGETGRVTALFRDIREQLEGLEKRVLSEISRQEEKISLQIRDALQQLEEREDGLSRKIHQIEKLCSMVDPLTVLQGKKPEGGDSGGKMHKKRNHKMATTVEDLDGDVISESLFLGLAGIVAEVKEKIYGQEATGLVMDRDTAGNNFIVSEDNKTASYSHNDLHHPHNPKRFQIPQALSVVSFPTGRHYWEVEGSESGSWMVGMAYTNIKRAGKQSQIGDNDKSWGLYRYYNNYSVIHDGKGATLNLCPPGGKIRISLDYEAGHLSFYQLSDPIRHLHTFTATFTEPLHAAFWVFGDNVWVRLLS
ncbi:hypothetical protein GDO86_004774 [Hymenochirus boettgeri]|uniref:Uncharacterized protein n=1 Tax=Hymenochirus boettgeri TaxID=247094 RepID=A0A8T2KFC4_9PIPI|nr:hypothetical protein GDO86_004774 [Hymenochirus boettgeri]